MRSPVAFCRWVAVAGTAACICAAALAQPVSQTPSVGNAAEKKAIAASAPGGSASKPVVPAAKTEKTLTQPLWQSLTDAQKAALRPLFADWAHMPSNQKRKWIELSANFATLPPTEQAKIHTRMAAWTALTPAQRAQARLNYSDASGLDPQQRKESWAAYQALSPEEKQKLRALNTAEQPKGAALAPRTAASDRLAVVPRVKSSNPNAVAHSPGKASPKIALAASDSAPAPKP